MPVCDGCGEPVDDAHIRRRIERLELATRFRPIHIDVLLVDAAPPIRIEDFLYNTSSTAHKRSAAGQWYVDELTKVAAASADTSMQLESMLAQLQHRGFFLASAVECPTTPGEKLVAAIRRLARTVVLRIQTSYRPKHIALIGAETGELIEPLRAASWGDRLILDDGGPFAIPSAVTSTNGSPATIARPFGDRLLAALAHST